ncbi:MlaD family protein [Mucilaginibacter sp. UR6-1]|uniref:MlaD family protein n=1 Tax=Mucilaginibacter sp. UR6-1 TaxID=1435643 RepID=UPI001E45D4EA|nr:MlaD family protein [Mucilaginibacter sp. UR6-1]MCC8408854.1 MlaD family protein [Mucilaginibacter sp. UR6-1]
MDASERKNAIIVGIFIALGTIIFVVGVLTLGSSSKSFVKSINIRSTFSDVAGLKKGSNIWFSGVKIGTVKEIAFSSNSQVEVVMSVDAAVQPYIHRNTQAKIGSDGLIGNKIIVLDGGSPQAPAIEDGDRIQSEKMLSTDEMMSTLQENNRNLLSITKDFKQLSSQILQGKGTVGALLADSTMALQLRSAMKNLQSTTESASRMAVQLDNFSNKMNTKGGLADKLLTDTATFAQIRQSVAQLQQTAANASMLTDNLNKASSKLNTTDNALGILLNDRKTAVKMQNTLNYLEQSSIKLNDDLEAAQHNFLLRGFFKKREKARADSLKGK